MAVKNGEGRQLPYDALDPEWEALEFQNFQATAGKARQQAPYGAYLFGRLLQSDLHQSCRPALPENVAQLNGSTIEGMCILQVVDVANIGANQEHRTEFSAAGPTRTLKLGLTDGHQLVFGFEYTSLPQFSVNVPRGTKVVVENVPVRHGLLLLGTDNCQLLETAADYSRRGNKKEDQLLETDALNAGVYSSALVTSQFNLSQQKLPPLTVQHEDTESSTRTLKHIDAIQTTSVENSIPSPSVNTLDHGATPTRARISVPPSVFVDEPSSNEDVDSDTTDPMVEHLFYSPKTSRDVDALKTTSKRSTPSRKRPRSPPVGQTSAMTSNKVKVKPILTSTQSSSTIIAETVASSSRQNRIGQQNGMMSAGLPLNPTRPFQYFAARLPILSAPLQAPVRIQIRACIKSVIGFQFNHGKYQLRVSVEDCTATRDADVAEAFVTQLMGVPCSEFLRTMQTNVQIAHKWAASMQFALMNLEGVMTFDMASGSTPLMLVNCRDFHSSDTRELLQRVKSLLPLKPR